MEQENKKTEVVEAAEASVKPQSSGKKMPNSLKAISKIAKSVAQNFVKTKNAKVTASVQKKTGKNKNKSISEVQKKTEEKGKSKLITGEENLHINTTGKEHVENGQQIEKGLENSTASHNNQEKAGISVSDEKQNKEQKKDGDFNENRNKKELDGGKERKQNGKEEKHHCPEKNNKNGGKYDNKKGQHNKEEKNNKNGGKHDYKKGQHNEKKEDKNNKNGGKHDHKKGLHNQKKEKVDGLIFMCSAKTKPDCFRYQVMGVSAGKKDFVLGIRPGLKLFLYDFDLKLMYGIYKACSSGGMKVEPKAFGGAFPAQVRFRVHSDCYPLPENIFKKAIKENYNERNKFKLELTARQVRKLTELFRPVAIRSTGLSAQSPPREVYDGRREPRPHLQRETSFRDSYAHVDARSYGVMSQGRDHEIAYRELTSREREEIPRDLYLSEKDYRAYGLQGERRNMAAQQHHIAPPLDPYRREVTHADPLYLREDPYRTYDLGARLQMPSAVASTSSAALDSYPNYSRDYGAISGDAYLRSTRTDTYSFAADPQSGYQQTRLYQGLEPQGAPMPVSSRYSFATPSVSYRRLEL